MFAQQNKMKLHCHCDHCPNNTCITRDNGLCWAKLTLINGKIEKSSNCYNQESRLMQNLICDDSIRTSKEIVRCCSSDYCNVKDDFLPPPDEARDLLLNYSTVSSNDTLIQSPAILSYHPHEKSSFSFEQYSNIPLGMKVFFIAVIGFMLIVLIALTQNFLSRRRRSPRNQVNNPEDHSENSSNLINSDAAVYDTNSMASREPLISNNGNNNQGLNPISLTFQPNSLQNPLPNKGPWMSDEAYNGKIQSTFQMSIGAGDPKKREASSGSGSGQPYLNQRSIAHDIELIEVVGRGYFGVVWRGEYKGEPVAVKIFSALAEPSWEREAEIYQTTLLRHKNILGFIATDKRDDISMTGYWLVTDYYPMGSLYDFLKSNSLSMPDAVRMAFSIANGLAHLHIEIFGTQGKPAIAHRDLKSKNILVKNDGTCCIADLGMAVRYNSNSGVVDVPANTRVGTRRYLAPELLENKLNLMDFEAVKATDVYALGLVLWEVLRRTCYLPSTATEGNSYSNKDQLQSDSSSPRASTAQPESSEKDLAIVCDPYQAPYQEYVSIDPTTEEMREIVCNKKVRPPTSARWTRFAPMRDFTTLMRECWYERPSARLSALRIRKTLGEIARHHFSLNMEYD